MRCEWAGIFVCFMEQMLITAWAPQTRASIITKTKPETNMWTTVLTFQVQPLNTQINRLIRTLKCERSVSINGTDGSRWKVGGDAKKKRIRIRAWKLKRFQRSGASANHVGRSVIYSLGRLGCGRFPGPGTNAVNHSRRR